MVKKVDKLETWRSVSGTMVFFLYFILTQLRALPLAIFGVDVSKMSDLAQSIYLLAFQGGLVGLFIYILWDDIVPAFKDFVGHFREYVKKYFKYWLVLFGAMIICNMAILLLRPNSIANNQAIIVDSFKTMPVYVYISAVVLAPLLEELVFRKSLRNVFKNDWFFIFISGFVFGGMHVFDSMGSWFDLIYIIPYSIPGFVFAYTLVKSKNIFVPVGLHFFHNFLLMTCQAILLFV